MFHPISPTRFERCCRHIGDQTEAAEHSQRRGTGVSKPTNYGIVQSSIVITVDDVTYFEGS